MDKDDADLGQGSQTAHRRSDALGARSRQLGEGRLGTYTMLGAACGIVPLPWIPDATVRRVRGALVHDLTSRHGLSLTPEARTILVEPNGTEGPRGFLKQGAKFAVGRVLGRLGPFAMIAPVRSALGTYVPPKRSVSAWMSSYPCIGCSASRLSRYRRRCPCAKTGGVIRRPTGWCSGCSTACSTALRRGSCAAPRCCR